MANPLLKEQQLYDQIKREKVIVNPFIWDTMYHFLGDYISVINMVVSYYIDRNEPIPIDESRKILDYTRKIKMMVDKILHPETIEDDNQKLEKIKSENMKLHPLVQEFFTHYIGNDTHVINLCVSYYLDPLDEQPIPVRDAQKILLHVVSMHQFLDRLREATHQN